MKSPRERLKILISAYSCSPFQGSEAGVGWGFVSALARHHDLWVIVEEEKFRNDIELWLSEHPDIGRSVQFRFVRKKRNRTLRKLWPPSYYWYYRRWHQDAYSLAKQLHSTIGFDLVHQLTMVGFREPGFLWKLGIPFVWGPVGGMGLFPWRFLPAVGLNGALYYLGYNFFNLFQMNFQQRPKLAAKAAGNGLITATPENKSSAMRYWNCASTLICEVGLPPVSVQPPVRRQPNQLLRIVWSGQHTSGKALNLAIQALSSLPPSIQWSLHVLGSGERTADWKRMCEKLNIADRCQFHGWLDRDKAMAVMVSAHIMLITSLRDLTSTVTIEALALGLPIICLDHCGFSSVVDDSCGIRVPVESPVQVVSDLAKAITRLALDEDCRYSLALGAITHAQAFSWEKKAEAVGQIYRRKLTETREPAT